MKSKTILLRASILAALALGAARSQGAELVAGWDFEKVEADGVTIKSVTGNYAGTISGSAVLTDGSGGRPKGGGKGFDISQNNPGWLLLEAGGLGEGEANPFTKAAANDSVTVTMWQKNNSNINSSSIWAIGPGFDRAFQFHIPWSDGTIYFDTGGGCCAQPTQRLARNVVGAFPDHDWTAWHHYAFIKDQGYKAIYVDGELLTEQEDGAAPLPTEYTQLTIGGANNASPPDAVIDDVAIFKGRLTVDEIKALVAGNSPFVAPADTDKDGIPDNWETQYGFNPNSAADATLDPDGDGCDNLCEYKAGSDPKDTTKPTVISAVATGTFDTVVITLSEEVDPATATTLSNYTITPALNITEATYKKRVVTLKTAAQTPGATKYTVAVKGVRDLSKNEVPVGSSAVFYSFLRTRDGVLRFAAWSGIPGNAVQGLLDDPRYPAEPTTVLPVFSMNSRDAYPTDANEQYGAVMEGFVTPTESGNYRFFLRSDDNGLLQVSTDDKEANLEQVAEQTGCCNGFAEPDSPFTSEPRALVAGRKYFIRVFYKEGGGGDWCEVAWRREGDTTPAGSLRPIPSQFLSAAVDLPAAPEGAWVTRSPAPGARNVVPVSRIRIAHRDGKTAWTSANTTMKFDGQAVTPTYTKTGNVLTMDYDPKTLFASGSVHTVTVGYLDAGGNPATYEYTFTAATYSGTTADKVSGYPALLMGGSVYTADAGGATGKAGDKAINLTTRGGPVVTFDAGFLAKANAATANDELTVSFWQKKLNTSDSSAFTLHSPSAGNNRGFHAHVPWSNQNVYFDTVGCCDGATQRITADINTFEDYTTGDPRDNLWWTTMWHHWVFTKKGSQKNIYIDGKLFLNGDSTNPLRTDHTAFYMGSGAGGAELSHAIIDDFAVFGKELSLADAAALKNGTLPTALPAAKGLIAYWDFNAAAATAPVLSAARGAAGKVTLTFEGTLQSSATAGGTYTDVAGASPLTVDATDSRFYRAVRK